MGTAPPNPPRNGEGDRAKRGGGGSKRLRRPAVYTARRLRREMTPPEALLWQQLKQRPHGIKFRRQHPLDPYVVDFFCPSARLVIEVDGWAHDTAERAEGDKKRDRALVSRGFSILRIPADYVMRDLEGAVSGILERVGNPLHRRSGGPPPRSGEDV
ncbi:MAG TPA: endonuclease domain-containing protein [Allosphingosinicella sp.]|nr:endonuclease domain-containing protein [Allosphingosinicella sp.]